MAHPSSPDLTRKVPKGTSIFVQGEPSNTTYIVMRGKVSLSVGLRGRQVPLFIQSGGAVLGLPETILGTVYQATATATTPVIVHAISRDDVLELTKDPESGMAILSLLTRKLTQIYAVLKLRRGGRGGTGASRLFGGLYIKSGKTEPTIH